MGQKAWFLCLETHGQKPLLNRALNRSLFDKTLRILENSGSLVVRACDLSPFEAKLVVRGPFKELTAMSERVMQLACRTKEGKFWDSAYTYRSLTEGEEQNLILELGGRDLSWNEEKSSIVASLL